MISYLDAHPENFYRSERTVDGMQFVTARGWEDLSEMMILYEELGKKMDEQVIVQYLQYPRIARDFSAYLELYYRCQKDFQVPEILAGRIPAGVLEKLRYAPFDERVEIVSLLLGALNDRIGANRKEDHSLSLIFDFLRSFRQKSSENEEMPSAELFQKLLDDLRNSVRKREEAGQSERSLREEYREVFLSLERYQRSLPARDERSAFELLRGVFEKDREKLERDSFAVLDLLEHAFDFMEAAFGESTEMVYFITELSLSPGAASFLREYECPRYYRYNKALLFEDEEAQVRKELAGIRREMEGGDL